MFITTATNRIIGVTRKCFKDSGLLDVGSLPLEASSFALTSVLRRRVLTRSRVVALCRVTGAQARGLPVTGLVPDGGGPGNQAGRRDTATALLGVSVGT